MRLSRAALLSLSMRDSQQRLDFAPDELVALGRALEKRERAKAKQRMSQGGKGWKISTPSEGGKTRDKVAAVAGVSGRTYEKAKQVVEAAPVTPPAAGLVPHRTAAGRWRACR
jgi:ParB family chromosome partitioning protein